MRKTLFLLALCVASPVTAQQGAILALGSPPVLDSVLALNRGRFALPGGQELALAVRTDTSIDGRLVLRSVLAIDSAATLSIYAPTGTPTGKSADSVGRSAVAPAAPGVSVTVDAATGMPTLRAAPAAAPTVSVSSGTAQAPSNDGLVQLPVMAGGPAIDTANGSVRLSPAEAGRAVTLGGDGIGVTQLLGPGFGSVIANTANNRTIDTVTNVDISLSGAASALAGSAMMRIAGLVTSNVRAPF